MNINDELYYYSYSRECDDCDGIISIDPVSRTIIIVKKSKSDEDEIDKENTIEMAEELIDSNYPEQRTVMFY